MSEETRGKVSVSMSDELQQRADQYAKDHQLTFSQVVQTALDKREALGSTGMGGGIAVPHARLPGLARPFGLMVRLRKPIDFDAVDGEPVDIVFLLLLPEPGSTQALAMVARKLRDRSLLEKFRSAKDARELHALIAGPG